eukprot:1019996-Prorocentrum_minimum.AAC.1
MKRKRAVRLLPETLAARCDQKAHSAPQQEHTAFTDQSQPLNRNIPHLPTDHSPSIGIHRIYRPITVLGNGRGSPARPGSKLTLADATAGAKLTLTSATAGAAAAVRSDTPAAVQTDAPADLPA